MRGRESNRQRIVLVVHGEADEMHLRPLRHRETIEAGNSEGGCDLSRAVGAKVKEDYRITIPNRGYGIAAGAGDYDGLDKLVGHIALVRLSDRRQRIFGRLHFAIHQEFVSALSPLPMLVAIHRIITPDHGRDLAHADLSALVLHGA